MRKKEHERERARGRKHERARSERGCTSGREGDKHNLIKKSKPNSTNKVSLRNNTEGIHGKYETEILPNRNRLWFHKLQYQKDKKNHFSVRIPRSNGQVQPKLQRK